jgi:MoaA/NifB/PqqE/SkfB family radical SAM enzyme
VIGRVLWRLARETDPRLLARFGRGMLWNGVRAVNTFNRRVRRGEYFPAFLFLSLTNACNLRCQGCWVTPTTPPLDLPLETASSILADAAAHGCRFFGLMGGEPLLYKDLFTLCARHPDCYFQLFTNGTLINEHAADAMRRLGNITPLISVEGLAAVSDERRGGNNVFAHAMHAIALCRHYGLITGVATSVCASNFQDVVSDAFVRDMIGRGVHYLWYYIYRPVGAMPCPELALTHEQILSLRRFIVDARTRHPILIIDAYWDHRGHALCPAAVGISHHINPAGDIEPCPPFQFACDNVNDRRGLVTTVNSSPFLASMRALMQASTRGCLLIEQPARLADALERSDARDTTGRSRGLAELRARPPCASHDLNGEHIPERHWFYRLAKKYWFGGFGAYG